MTLTNRLPCFVVQRYIYGLEINFELTELYESYKAADKYLLHEFNRTFFDYVKSKLNSKSSFLIYDQLVKIGEQEESPLASVRAQIIENSRKLFESEDFTEIGQETLISLLSLDELKIAEFDLLIAVLKWVDCKVQRQGLPVNGENRRRVFEPIKGYILFTSLKTKQIASCEEIAELLTIEERGSLLLHKLDEKNPSMIELETSRRAGSNVCSVFVENDSNVFILLSYAERTKLTVTRTVYVRTIYTTFSAMAQHMCLKIRDSTGADLGLEVENFVQNGRLCFLFSTAFVMEPNSEYTLQVIGDGQMTEEDYLSSQLELKYDESLVFKFTEFCHCVRGFLFYL